MIVAAVLALGVALAAPPVEPPLPTVRDALDQPAGVRSTCAAPWSASAGRASSCGYGPTQRRTAPRLCVELHQRGLRRAAVRGRAAALAAGRRRAARRRRARAAADGAVRVLEASFHPRVLGLRDGLVRWAVVGGADRLPDRGYGEARIGPLVQTRCFGAAARAATPCRNPDLLRSVIPRPSVAVWSPGSPCYPQDDLPASAILRPCEFGDRSGDAAPQAALIGDSHADHWRGAVDVAAQARGWRAVSMTRAGCSFSTEAYPAPAPIPANCRRHSEGALQWLRTHPSVHTVFTSSSAGRGLSAGGYQAMWRRLPATVKRVYVLRDVPRVNASTGACVSRTRGRTDTACTVPRGAAIIGDSSAQAAARAGGRVRLIDLTRHFCSTSRCFPVVGGAYVYKDANHMNATFATTLGPFLLRRL